MTTQTPIRIAFCITELDPGGAEQTLVQLVTRLDRSEWEPQVFCLGPEGALVQPIRDAGIPIMCFGATGIVDSFVVFRLASQLEKFRPAVLQSFLFHANIMGRIAAKLSRVPVVVSGIRVAERRSRWPLRIDRWTNSLVDQNVAVSQSVANFTIDSANLSEKKVTVIPNGVDCRRFKAAIPTDLISEFGIPADDRVLLFVGRLEHQKAPELLMQSAPSILTEFNDCHLLLVGEGPMATELAEEAKLSAFSHRIHFAGRRKDVPSLMRASTLLLSPSRWEGMPNVVLEAMAAGLPVVATDVEGVAELIEDSVSGWLVGPNSAQKFASALIEVLKTPHNLPHVATTAQTIVSERFTYEAMTQRYTSLYRDLLSEIP